MQKTKRKTPGKGLTQADVYEDLKISRKTYSSWENGLWSHTKKSCGGWPSASPLKRDYFINKESALYTYPLLTPPHQKESRPLASQLLEQQQKLFPWRLIRFFSVELAAGLGHTFMTTKQTMKPSILTKRSSMILRILGIRKFDGTSLPQWLCCPSWSRPDFDYDGAALRPHLEWKTYIKKVYREAEGLRLESINPDYDDLFCSLWRRAQNRRHCGRAFSSTRGLNMLFDYSREPHSDIAFVDMKSFMPVENVSVWGLNPLTTSLCVMSRSDNSAGLILVSSPVSNKSLARKMLAVATTYLLTSKPGNLIAMSLKSKDCPQIQPLLHPLNPGPRGLWLYLHGWMPIFRSIWRFKKSFRNLQHQMIFSLTRLTKVLSIWPLP